MSTHPPAGPNGSRDRAPMHRRIPVLVQLGRRATLGSLLWLAATGVAGCSWEQRADVPALEPAYEGSEIVGIRANRVDPSGPLAKAGVAPGDVILRINGIALDDEAAGASIAAELISQERYTLRLRAPDGSERESSGKRADLR